MAADSPRVRPRGRYRVVRVDGDLFSTSAIGPMSEDSGSGFSHHGRVGADLSVEDGRAAARVAAEAVLAALEDELGYLGRIAAVRHVRGFIAASEGFTAHAEILDAASDVIVGAFGERGEHARSAIGVATLPFDLPIVVEVEGRLDGATP